MYLDPQKIIDRLPGSYPQAYKDRYPDADEEQLTGMWLSKIEAEIAHYSRYIDDSVGQLYPRAGVYKFPAWDAENATPGVIGEICFGLVYSSLLDYFNPVSKGSESEDESTYRSRAEDMLSRIRKGEIAISLDSGVAPKVDVSIITRENVFTELGFRSFGK